MASTFHPDTDIRSQNIFRAGRGGVPGEGETAAGARQGPSARVSVASCDTFTADHV